MSAEPAGFVWEWELAPPLVTALVVAGVAYVLAWTHADARSGRQRRSWEALVLFAGGLVTIVIALLSPIGANDERFLSMHMLEHSLLIWVAVPLLIAGAAPLVGDTRRLPRLPQRVLAVLTHPVVAWLGSSILLWGWHAPPAYGLALQNQRLHYLEHLCFLAGYLLYWWPLLAPSGQVGSLRSDESRVAYLLAGMAQSSLLGALITFHPTVLYDAYLEVPGVSAASALADQRLAGMLMWLPGMVVFVVLAALVIGRRAPEAGPSS